MFSVENCALTVLWNHLINPTLFGMNIKLNCIYMVFWNEWWQSNPKEIELFCVLMQNLGPEHQIWKRAVDDNIHIG